VTLELDGVPILFIDTPGLAWKHSEEAPPEEKDRRRAQDILLRNKGRIDRLKDPLPALSYIVSRAETEDLMVFYGLPAFPKGDVDAFLMGVARAQGLIKKVSQSPVPFTYFVSISCYLIFIISILFSGG
jgi:nuclear GTP-binding protein